MSDLHDQFGEIDIYLFDQLLRRRLVPGMRVFDVGCGTGRNLVYLLQAGYEVFGIDPDPVSIQAVQRLAAKLAPHLPAASFRVESIETTPPGLMELTRSLGAELLDPLKTTVVHGRRCMTTWVIRKGV